MSKLFTYTVGEKLVFDTKEYDLKNHNGELVEIVDKQEHGSHDYYAQFEDNQIIRVKEKELQPLRKEFHNMSFQRGQKVRVMPKDERGTIQKLDWLHGQAEVLFEDNSYVVVGFEKLRKIDRESVDVEKEGEKMVKGNDYFESKGSEIGSLVTKKQAAYGDSVGKAYKLMQVFMQDYDNGDDTYTIPKELLQHILLQVRIIDKQNRIFSNPKGDLMSENPYADTVGYGLLGMRMSDEILNK